MKIDNHPNARRNQTGLAVADIVFEEIVEGGASSPLYLRVYGYGSATGDYSIAR